MVIGVDWDTSSFAKKPLSNGKKYTFELHVIEKDLGRIKKKQLGLSSSIACSVNNEVLELDSNKI